MFILNQSYSKYISIALIFILALGLRLIAVNNTVVDVPLRADAGDYYSYALNLKKYGVYSRERDPNKTPTADAVRSPGYPLFLLAFVDDPPSDESVSLVMLVQSIIDSLCVLVALLIFRYIVSERWALTAAVLCAVSPHLISATTYMLTETLFTFLMFLSVWLVLRAYSDGQNKSLALVAGLVLACAALTRPTLQFFIIPLIFLIYFHYGYKVTVRSSVLLLAGFVLIFSIWPARNMISIGTMSDPRLAINALHHGMYPDFRYKNIPQSTGFPYRFDPRSSTIAQNKKTVLEEIGRRFREQPGRHALWYFFKKPVSLLSWNIVAGMGDVFIYPVKTSPFKSNYLFIGIHFVMKTIHWLLVTLSILAAILAWVPAIANRLTSRALFATRVLSLLLMYFIAVHIVGAPFPRYGIPLRPVIYGLAMLFISQYYAYVRELQRKRKETTGKQSDRSI